MFSPLRGMCPVVELTGLGSLCLSKSGRVPRMCVGAVESVKRVDISEKFVNKDIEPCLSILGVCPVVKLNGLGSLCLS